MKQKEFNKERAMKRKTDIWVPAAFREVVFGPILYLAVVIIPLIMLMHVFFNR